MKASKNINTAPASGKTSGMTETMPSTASGWWTSLWGVGVDMAIPQFIYTMCKKQFYSGQSVYGY
jgi:hypothetical protein